MRRAIVALLLALAVPAAAWAATRLTAREIRIADHPALVRVVVEFDGGTRALRNEEVRLRTPTDLFRNGRARVDVSRPRIASTAPERTQGGVRARVLQRPGAVRVRLDASERRFKAVEERILRDPDRLVLDLWRSAPPTGAAVIRNDGCLALDGIAVAPGRVRLTGRALRRLFENALVVTVRGQGGRVVGERPATAARGRWQRTVPYTVARRQRGTVEAAVYSAKDGSLECLVQVARTLVPG